MSIEESGAAPSSGSQTVQLVSLQRVRSIAFSTSVCHRCSHPTSLTSTDIVATIRSSVPMTARISRRSAGCIASARHAGTCAWADFGYGCAISPSDFHFFCTCSQPATHSLHPSVESGNGP